VLFVPFVVKILEKSSISLCIAFTNSLHSVAILKISRKDRKMKKTNWLVIGIVSIVAILILFWVGTMIGGGYRGYGMMGGMMGGRSGMMDGWGFSPLGIFGMGLGMLLVWLLPIALVALAVYGVVSLARNTGTNASAPLPPCPNCGKTTQADWQNCPYCGTTLK
jgi:uncharacterized membrane protein